MAKANVSLAGRDILDLESLSVGEINLVESTAAEMKKIMKRDIKKVPALRGKLLITLFYEPSTRTRTSFETAAKYLGADVVNITTSTSSVVKGECLRDTILTLENMGCDGIIMRSPCEGAAVYAAQVAKPVIINAGDGAHAHPSQGLLDLFYPAGTRPDGLERQKDGNPGRCPLQPRGPHQHRLLEKIRRRHPRRRPPNPHALADRGLGRHLP
jgi:aspartate carbamoyltransferase catalytic subunit